MDARTLASTLPSFDDEIITILAGPEEGKLSAHRSRLELSSPFFQAALKKEWKEGQDKTLKLPEDDPTTVRIYLHYLYSGNIACKVTGPNEPAESDKHDAEYVALAKLYVLGEKYQDDKVKKEVTDAIVAKTEVIDDNGWHCFPTDEAVDVLYRGTTSTSPIRRLMVDLHVAWGVVDWLVDSVNNAEFLWDLAYRFMSMSNQSRVKASVPKISGIRAADYYEEGHAE